MFSTWLWGLCGYYLSNLVGKLVRLPVPIWARKWVYGSFNATYGVVVSEAEFPISTYPTMGSWFTRGLVNGCRPQCDSPWVSPVDGVVVQSGTLTKGELIQAKGLYYSLRDLTQTDSWDTGTFICIYLSPKDCHRIMSPVSGQLRHATHIPGSLYPVRPHQVATIPQLYCVNERLSMGLTTPNGDLFLVAVGALNVGSISTQFDPTFKGQHTTTICHRTYHGISTQPGDWLATFHLGSTVILITQAVFTPIPVGQPIQIGQSLVAS